MTRKQDIQVINESLWHSLTPKQGAQVVEGFRRCTHCKRMKRLDQFGLLHDKGRKPRLRSWCKACVGIAERLRDETPKRKAWLKTYLAQPDVRQRRRESNRHSQARETPEQLALRAARRRRYARSERGQAMQCRSRAVRKLEGATGEVERDRLTSVIRMCDREIKEIKP